MNSFLIFLKAFLCIALFNISQVVNAQLVEGFEQGSKSSYSKETDLVEFESGEWLLNDAMVDRSDDKVTIMCDLSSEVYIYRDSVSAGALLQRK